MRLIMEGFGSKQYEVVCPGGMGLVIFYVRRASDNARTYSEVGYEGLEVYREIKHLWRQKGHAYFNTRCARMKFYHEVSDDGTDWGHPGEVPESDSV